MSSWQKWRSKMSNGQVNVYAIIVCVGEGPSSWHESLFLWDSTNACNKQMSPLSASCESINTCTLAKPLEMSFCSQRQNHKDKPFEVISSMSLGMTEVTWLHWYDLTIHCLLAMDTIHVIDVCAQQNSVKYVTIWNNQINNICKDVQPSRQSWGHNKNSNETIK